MPCQPYGPGHFSFPYRGIYPLHPPHSKVTPCSGRAGGWVVFPPPNSRARTGEGVIGIMPHLPRASGFLVWGHGWPSSGHICPVSYRVFKGFTKCIPIKSGSIVRSFRKYRRSPSAALRGLWVFPCPGPWIRRSACCPPCFLRVLSACPAKTTQNVNLAPLANRPPQFPPACPGAFRGP
jgi:hypothetical protein